MADDETFASGHVEYDLVSTVFLFESAADQCDLYAFHAKAAGEPELEAFFSEIQGQQEGMAARARACLQEKSFAPTDLDGALLSLESRAPRAGLAGDLQRTQRWPCAGIRWPQGLSLRVA